MARHVDNSMAARRGPWAKARPITKLSEEREDRQAEIARQVALHIESLNISKQAKDEVSAGLKAQLLNQKRWRFIMLGPDENEVIVDRILETSTRPLKAARLWAKILPRIHPHTGEVQLSRQDMAERVGVTVQNVSEIMSELVKFGAIERERHGNRVKYFMSARIATHIPTEAARQAARDSFPPILAAVDGTPVVPAE